MAIYVYSTLTSGQNYNTDRGTVSINGGANLARSGVLDTPRGVATEITNEQYSALKENPVFQLHCDNGFVTADSVKFDANQASESLAGKDKSSQKTEDDFKATEDLKINTRKK